MEEPSNQTWFLRKHEDGSIFGPPATSEDERNLANEPVATGISVRLQERVRDLEQSLRAERRALMEAEQRCAELERKYQELLSNG